MGIGDALFPRVNVVLAACDGHLALDTLDTFYGEVVQHIKPWAAAPPKLREADRTADVADELVSTDLSSQDGPQDAD